MRVVNPSMGQLPMPRNPRVGGGMSGIGGLTPQAAQQSFAALQQGTTPNPRALPALTPQAAQQSFAALQQRMKKGGMVKAKKSGVRGAGCATRGHGKGKVY